MNTAPPIAATAVITGASGLVGGNLAALLVADGVKVRAAKRAGSRIDHLRDLDIEWVDADLGDGDALTRAFTGAHVVFHCAAVPSQTRRLEGPHRQANVDGSKRVVAAVKRAGAGRLVHVSSVVTCAIAKDGAPDVVESDPWNFADYGLDEIYAVTKREAELAVLASDVDMVVVNPGLMFGPRDAKPSSGRLIMEVSAGRVPGSTSGSTCIVDVRDVCRGMIAAWRQGKRGERYILGGPNVSYAELFALIAKELGRKPPRLALPDALVKASGVFGDLVERVTGREITLNSAVTSYAVCAGYRFSSDKAKRELGYTVSPVDVAIREAIAWFRARGMLPPAATSR